MGWTAPYILCLLSSTLNPLHSISVVSQAVSPRKCSGGGGMRRFWLPVRQLKSCLKLSQVVSSMSDNFEDELDEREDPDPEDADWNLDRALIACPYCGGDITEDTVSCPHCGNYISAEDRPYNKSFWLVAGIVLLVILTVVGWLWMR